METIKKIIQKLFTKEVMLYAIFGVLTTVVNIGAFYVMTNLLHWNEDISNAIAIILAVLVAYVTNKDLVFHSEAQTVQEKGKEFAKFMAGRAFTMVVEYVGCLILFRTPIPQMISKCAMTVIVIILNFFISKFFAFKRKAVETK